MQGVSQNMTVGGYSCECHLPYHVFDIKAFLPKKIFYSLNFILKSILQEYDCYIIFFIIKRTLLRNTESLERIETF